jgi:hypothetical protein
MKPEHRLQLHALADLYGPGAIIAELHNRKPGSAPLGKGGKPRVLLGNLAGVWGYVEALANSSLGSAAGIKGACAELASVLEKWTVQNAPPFQTIERWYYKARSLIDRNAEFADVAHQMRDQFAASFSDRPQNEGIHFPIIFARRGGELVSPVIDTMGLGGREPSQN